MVRDCFILLHRLVGRNVIIIQIIFFYNNRTISRALIGRQIWSMRLETVVVTWWRNSVFSLARARELLRVATCISKVFHQNLRKLILGKFKSID